MTKEYSVFKIEGYATAIVFMNVVDDVAYYLHEILAEVDNKDFIVDSFVSTGYSYNRFTKYKESNGKPNFIMVNSRDIPEAYNHQFKFHLKKNIDILDESVLPNSMKDITKSIIRNI